LLLPIAIGCSAWKHRGMSWSRKGMVKSASIGQSLLLIIGLLNALVVLLRIPGVYWHQPPAEAAVEIEFPLRGGVYSISHGGASTTLNYHYAYPNQTYAIDIVKLNVWGMRKKTISTPSKPEEYEIYGEPVYSPVDGTVIKTIDGKSDVTSGENKVLSDPWSDFTEHAEEIYRDIVEDSFEQFVQVVMEGRNMSKEQVLNLADGRVFSGKKAKSLGLIDQFGSLEDAVDYLKNELKMPDIKVIRYARKTSLLDGITNAQPVLDQPLTNLIEELIAAPPKVMYLMR
jgi:hypothetical protein